MSYIVNQARVHSLEIGGTDYTDSLVSWTASDSSANQNGIIVTSGTLVIGSSLGGPPVDDYDRNDFKRGVEIILTMSSPSGSTYRHPRGLLYVVSSSYNVESETLEVAMTCRLGLATITDDPSNLLPLAPIPLDPAQKELSNVSASFATAGQLLYQNNQGDLVSREFFQGDSEAGVAPGEWSSILGVTAMAAAPLQASAAIPDRIDLTFRVPEDKVSSDQAGYIESTQTDSYYYLSYPASISKRIGNGSLPESGLSPGSGPPGGGNDPCGNTPDDPGGNRGSCQEDYSVEQQPLVLPATRTQKGYVYYNGPAGQQSFSETTTYGPLVEANSQYIADQYAYCIGRYASRCLPDGNCPKTGMDQVTLSIQKSYNYFGQANEVVLTVTEEYVNMRNLAKPSDWRSGLDSQGIPQDFKTLSPNQMIRSRYVETRYYSTGNSNVQDVTTYTSPAVGGSGLAIDSGRLDAKRYGIKTREVRRSSSTTTLDVAPDRVNSATTKTVNVEVELPLFTGRFTDNVPEAGPYVLEQQAPSPLLFNTSTEIDSAKEKYSDYLVRFIKGDAFGLQLGEGLREDVALAWYPGMPFRYFDPKKNKVLALRMDATSWGVTPQESAFSTNGIWVGFSDGSVTVPQNVLGASRAVDGGSVDPLTTAPNGPTSGAPPVVNPPVINNETSVDSGSFAWVVEVSFNLSAQTEARNDDGVQPPTLAPIAVEVSRTMTAYCEGFIVEAGSLLVTDTDGGLPIEYRGSLITTGAVIVDSDLFA